jgi:hypothetical protein
MEPQESWLILCGKGCCVFMEVLFLFIIKEFKYKD